jgi:SPP1 gp7 family putative phage head morphogenesis protein
MASEIWLRWELLQLVKRMTVAGAAAIADLRAMFAEPSHAWDAAPRPRSSLPGHGTRRLDALAAQIGNTRAQAEYLAALAVQKNLANVDERLTKAIFESVRVDVSQLLKPSSAIGHAIVPAMRDAAQAAADLITTIPERYLGRVRNAVTRAWVDGQRWEDLAKDLVEIGHITERRARLIARDQTSKMNAAFNEVRQTSLGIEEYTWAGVLDQRERKSHLDMEGQRCRWDARPLVDGDHVHPGEDINCRCGARPIINLGDLPDEFGEGEAA